MYIYRVWSEASPAKAMSSIWSFPIVSLLRTRTLHKHEKREKGGNKTKQNKTKTKRTHVMFKFYVIGLICSYNIMHSQ